MSSFQMRRLKPRDRQDSLGATQQGWTESGPGPGFSQPNTPPTPTAISPSTHGGLGQEYLEKLTGPFWSWSLEPIPFQMAVSSEDMRGVHVISGPGESSYQLGRPSLLSFS